MLISSPHRADTGTMAYTRRRTRSRAGRAADLVVAVAAVMLIASPMIMQAGADDAIITSPMTVGQVVNAAAVISPPAKGSFDAKGDGSSTGQVSWDVFSTDDDGFRMTVSTDADLPALRDRTTGIQIPDLDDDPGAWSVGAGQRRFGFSAMGDTAISSYDDGTKWRGFDGRTGILIARHGSGAAPMSTVTLKLKSEMNRPLPASADPKAYIVSTVTVNI